MDALTKELNKHIAKYERDEDLIRNAVDGINIACNTDITNFAAILSRTGFYAELEDGSEMDLSLSDIFNHDEFLLLLFRILDVYKCTLEQRNGEDWIYHEIIERYGSIQRFLKEIEKHWPNLPLYLEDMLYEIGEQFAYLLNIDIDMVYAELKKEVIE